VPFVFRESGEDFMLAGEAYVHYLMNGEALELEDCAVERITLVWALRAPQSVLLCYVESAR
jgi:hypothetical protein